MGPTGCGARHLSTWAGWVNAHEADQRGPRGPSASRRGAAVVVFLLAAPSRRTEEAREGPSCRRRGGRLRPPPTERQPPAGSGDHAAPIPRQREHRGGVERWRGATAGSNRGGRGGGGPAGSGHLRPWRGHRRGTGRCSASSWSSSSAGERQGDDGSWGQGHMRWTPAMSPTNSGHLWSS